MSGYVFIAHRAYLLAPKNPYVVMEISTGSGKYRKKLPSA